MIKEQLIQYFEADVAESKIILFYLSIDSGKS